MIFSGGGGGGGGGGGFVGCDSFRNGGGLRVGAGGGVDGVVGGSVVVAMVAVR